MEDIKQLMRHHYLKYASYVILDRAIPNVIDGLKPVQRRILHTLWTMDDGKLHKVANVAGQTMAYHPHGDAPITDALVNLANKNFLLDKQGNFGNALTGDPAAAARYIETRLSPLALETLFNPDLTVTMPSYDGRHREPVLLPVKMPLLLMQGAEGIAVGMSTYILPHNFQELIEAEIALLEGRDFELLPDFPTGGVMDATQYQKGKGKVKLRVKLDSIDAKTILISEICYGTTTESLIRSIDDAAKKGKIKLESINDYTSDKVAIELKLPRGHYASDLLPALYAFTECEVTLSPQMVTIKDDLPWEGDVHEILHLHSQQLQQYLQREQEIERDRLLEKVFEKTLERIFIENRLYKAIENLSSMEAIHSAIAEGLKPFHAELSRLPTDDDRERLLSIPIRRISLFDLKKNVSDITAAQSTLTKIEKTLKNIKKFTIGYLSSLLTKHATAYPRRTLHSPFEQINLRAVATRTLKIGIDSAGGFVGTKVTTTEWLECTNYDKLLLLYSDGAYHVINIPEKQYVGRKGSSLSLATVADKKTPIHIIYKDPATQYPHAKSFVIDKFIVEKIYHYIPNGAELAFIAHGASPTVELAFIPTARKQATKLLFNFSSINRKGVAAKGIRIAKKALKKITLIQDSTGKSSL